MPARKKKRVTRSTSKFGHSASASGSSRLDQAHVKVWVKVEDGKGKRRTTNVYVENTADVDGLIATVLHREKVDIAPGLVTVEFDGEEIEDSGLLATEFETSSQNPLLLKCPEGQQVKQPRIEEMVADPQGGEQISVQKQPFCDSTLWHLQFHSLETNFHHSATKASEFYSTPEIFSATLLGKH